MAGLGCSWKRALAGVAGTAFLIGGYLFVSNDDFSQKFNATASSAPVPTQCRGMPLDRPKGCNNRPFWADFLGRSTTP